FVVCACGADESSAAAADASKSAHAFLKRVRLSLDMPGFIRDLLAGADPAPRHSNCNSLPRTAEPLTLDPTVALYELDDEFRLGPLLRDRGEVVVLRILLAPNLVVERATVFAAHHHAEPA